MSNVKQCSPETRERTVRLVWEQARQHPSEWTAIRSIAEKVGCSPGTLRTWVRRAERDSGRRAGLTTDERERIRDLECENRELKRADEILCKASACFAQAEFARRPRGWWPSWTPFGSSSTQGAPSACASWHGTPVPGIASTVEGRSLIQEHNGGKDGRVGVGVGWVGEKHEGFHPAATSRSDEREHLAFGGSTTGPGGILLTLPSRFP
jgi:transposase